MNQSTGVSNALQAAVVAVVNAALGLLVAFGVGLSDTQIGAVLTFVNAALVVYFLFRNSKVTQVPSEAVIAVQADPATIEAFRLDRFVNELGFNPEQAEWLVAEMVDWHEAEKLLQAGCSHQLAVRILL